MFAKKLVVVIQICIDISLTYTHAWNGKSVISELILHPKDMNYSSGGQN